MDTKEEVKAETSKEEVKLEKSYTNNSFFIPAIIFVFFLAVCGWLIWQNQQTRTILEKFKTETLNEIQTCSTDDKNSIYSKRLENLENKYIDISASNQNINFWITIFSILIPLVLGVQLYQKGKFEDKAESELKEVRALMEKAREKIESLDDIADKKIKEIITKSDEAKEYLLNLKSEIIKELNELNSKYCEIEDKHLKFETETTKSMEKFQKDFEKLTRNKETLSNISNNTKEIFDRSNTLYFRGKYDEALNELKKAENTNNDNNQLYEQKGVLLTRMGKYDEALSNFNRIINTDHKDALTYYNISCLYALQNDIGNSLKNLEEALKLGLFKGKFVLENFYNDTDFDSIRQTEEFKAFVKKLEEKYPKNN